MKYVIVIEDGASDYPIEEIDGKTPLKIADKPVLDKIAREGKTGLIQNVPETLPPGSDVANMCIPLQYHYRKGWIDGKLKCRTHFLRGSCRAYGSFK